MVMRVGCAGNVAFARILHPYSSQYRDGTQSTLAQVSYTTKGSAINSVSAGVFFYYTKVTDGTEGDLVEITETNDSAYTAIPVQQGQAFLYNATTCTS